MLSTWWVPGACTEITLSPTDWTSPVAPGQQINVAAFTCAAQAELFVNGVSHGVRAVPRLGAASWPGVIFAPGNLTAIARDAAGAALGSATVRTAGPPAALRAWVESPYAPPRNGSIIAADGADVALIGVEVLDASGNVCPQGAVNISFSIAGPGSVYGVSNGDPTDHAPVKASWRRSYHGRVRAIIASVMPAATGDIDVTMSADGLAPATVRIIAQ